MCFSYVHGGIGMIGVCCVCTRIIQKFINIMMIKNDAEMTDGRCGRSVSEAKEMQMSAANANSIYH